MRRMTATVIALLAACLAITAVALAQGPSEPLPVDTDADGVEDSLDECPNKSGVESASGCPDKDGDSFRDGKDACPSRAGVERHDGCPGPYVVRTYKLKPRKHVHRRKHFTPDCCPSPSEVGRIADLEQRRWGGPSIRGRIYCESTNNYLATNGQYRGLLQIGSWWSYAYAQTPREVVLRDEHKRKRPVYRVKVYDTGRKERHRIRRMTQIVHVKKVGRLPSGASPYHGWAAIRVGQRAVSGDGPNTYWECGL